MAPRLHLIRCPRAAQACHPWQDKAALQALPVTCLALWSVLRAIPHPAACRTLVGWSHRAHRPALLPAVPSSATRPYHRQARTARQRPACLADRARVSLAARAAAAALRLSRSARSQDPHRVDRWAHRLHRRQLGAEPRLLSCQHRPCSPCLAVLHAQRTTIRCTPTRRRTPTRCTATRRTRVQLCLALPPAS